MHQLRTPSGSTALIKSSKVYKLNYRLLDQRFFFYFTRLVSVSKRSLQDLYKYRKEYFILFQLIFRNFLLNQKHLIHRISDIKTQPKTPIYEKIKNSFQVMPPKIITEFIRIQLTENTGVSLKKNNFSANLQGNILNFISLFLAEFKHDILGLKIICSGKWKKTRTGRKQKLYLKYGRIQSSNIANKIVYDTVSQKTKYGV
jgi:hypothetical protein